MKKIITKSFIFLAIIILVSSPLISSSSVELNTNQSNKINKSPINNNTNQKITQALENITESQIKEYLEGLVAIGPRMTGQYGCDKAAVYLYQTFEDMDLAVRYQKWIVRSQGKFHRLYKSQNVEAILPGTSLHRESIVFNAHYDSIAISDGANDDGSGVVAVLAAANVLRNYEFNRTIKFVQFAGEEVGLIGAREYVEESYDNNEDIFVEINADMIGYAETASGGRNASISPCPNTEWIIDEVKHVNNNYGINFNLIDRYRLDPDDDRGGSDFYHFLQYGYDVFAFWQYEHNADYWHTPDDTIEHINFSYLTNMTKLIVATIAHLADIENTHPQVQIGAPRRGRLYYEDRNLLDLKYNRIWVVDDFRICVEVKPGDAPIEKVEFYIDGKLKNTDTDAPYQWRLNERSIRKHALKVIAYDEAGRKVSDQLIFRHINIRLDN
jgi:hypothetical protein